MNIIEALRIWHEHLSQYMGGRGEFWQAHQAIGDLLAAYDALPPTLDLWPSDMQWFTVDNYGTGEWHTSEPVMDDGEWRTSLGESHYCGTYLLEPGIDWRSCKWPRPVTQ